MKMAVKDKITAVVIMILSIAGYMVARTYPMGAGAFSKSIFMGGFVLSIALYISTKMGLYKNQEKEEKINSKRISIIIGITILYFLLIEYIGYFIITPLFLFSLTIFLGYKNRKVLFLYPLIFTAFLYLVFRLFLNVPLPLGILAQI